MKTVRGTAKLIGELSVVTGLLIMTIAGCATTSEPTTVVVADKDVILHWKADLAGWETADRPLIRHPVVGEYFVKSTEGRWIRVKKEDWDAATVGEPLTLHGRALHDPSPSATVPWR